MVKFKNLSQNCLAKIMIMVNLASSVLLRIQNSSKCNKFKAIDQARHPPMRTNLPPFAVFGDLDRNWSKQVNRTSHSLQKRPISIFGQDAIKRKNYSSTQPFCNEMSDFIDAYV